MSGDALHSVFHAYRHIERSARCRRSGEHPGRRIERESGG